MSLQSSTLLNKILFFIPLIFILLGAKFILNSSQFNYTYFHFSLYGVIMNQGLRSTDLEGDSIQGVREWHP